MNEIDILIVLVVLCYILLDLLKDVKICFDPRILVLKNSAPLTFFKNSADKRYNQLHFLRSETFN